MKRKIIQIISAFLCNCNIEGFAHGTIYKGDLKAACIPGLNCYSCPGAVGACPIGSLQSSFTGAKTGIPYYVLGTLILFGVLLGRLICGFLCPFGLIQELLHKIPGPKIRKSRATRKLSCLKYAVLVSLAFAVPVILSEPGFCKYLCPAGTLEGGVFLSTLNPQIRSLLGGLFCWKAAVLVLILVSSVLMFRSFCRFLCPLGALYSLFNKISFCRMEVDESRCTSCGDCIRHCEMDIRNVGDRECIQCGECVKVCKDNAIRRIMGSEHIQRIKS